MVAGIGIARLARAFFLCAVLVTACLSVSVGNAHASESRPLTLTLDGGLEIDTPAIGTIFVPIRGTVDATLNGPSFTASQGGVSLAPTELEVAGNRIALSLFAAGPFSGTVDLATRTLSLTGSVRVISNAVQIGFEDCPYGPVNFALGGPGGYNPATGVAHIFDNRLVLPATEPLDECGGTIGAALMNQTLGTPTRPGQARLALTATLTPRVAERGVTGHRIQVREAAHGAPRYLRIDSDDPAFTQLATDPRVYGASLRVVMPGSDTTYDLASGHWRVAGTTTKRYAYDDTRGPITKVRVNNTGGRFVAIGGGSGLGMALASNPHSVDVILTVGNERFCATFGTGVRYTGVRFIATDSPRGSC
jgi:hypothetical protein